MTQKSTYKKKKKLGSYPYVSVIFSITLAVFVVGLFGVMIIFYNSKSEVIKKKISMHVYLDKEIEQSAKTHLVEFFKQQPYVAQEKGVKLFDYIPKDQAAKKFIDETGEDFVAFLGENPLRDAYVVYVDPKFSDAANMKTIKTHIQDVSGVYEVVYLENLVESINRNIQKVSLGLFIVSIILIFVSVLLINNSIKLALYSQRFIIRSMQLVGATNNFIRWPFLKRALVYGFTAGCIASALIFTLIQTADYYLEGFDIQLHVFTENKHIWFLCGIMLLIGSIIGFFSTIVAVNKYLHMKLEDLY